MIFWKLLALPMYGITKVGSDCCIMQGSSNPIAQCTARKRRYSDYSICGNINNLLKRMLKEKFVKHYWFRYKNNTFL